MALRAVVYQCVVVCFEGGFFVGLDLSVVRFCEESCFDRKEAGCFEEGLFAEVKCSCCSVW